MEHKTADEVAGGRQAPEGEVAGAVSWEIEAERGDGVRVLLGYTARPTVHGLRVLLHEHRDEVRAFLGLPCNGAAAAVSRVPGRGPCVDVPGYGAVRCTGRTHLQALREGELPFIVAVTGFGWVPHATLSRVVGRPA